MRYSPSAFHLRIFQLSIFHPCSPATTPILKFPESPFCTILGAAYAVTAVAIVKQFRCVSVRDAVSYLLFYQSHKTPHSTKTAFHYTLVNWLEFNVPFQHKYGYIRDEHFTIDDTP